MKKISVYLWLASAIFFMMLSTDSVAHHESWHKEGLMHEHNGLMVIPLRINERRITLPRKDCKVRGDCDLKEIVFFEEDDEFPIDLRVPGDFLGRSTMFMAGIETTNVAALKNYAFVQFIRGCMWNSEKSPDGSISTYFGISREHLGKRTHFVHQDWVVDTMDLEPVYSADEETGDRHFFLQWSNPRPKWIPISQEKLFGEETPTVPFGFVTDSPEPLAAVRLDNSVGEILVGRKEEAVNRSLEFRMCLYHTNDVPSITDGTTRGFGTPVACHNWRSSHVYDHNRGLFTSPPGVHRECGRPWSDEEKSNEKSLRSR